MKAKNKYILISLGSSVAGYIGYRFYKKQRETIIPRCLDKPHSLEWKPESRSKRLEKLGNTRFDLLIIGGGASGAGCALDAVTRGLSVGLVEYGDFASETSSKSTKLLHGGVRYLEKAFKTLSLSHFKLVIEALVERKRVTSISPYLTRPLPIMLPFYNYFSLPYFFSGLVLYDWISGSCSLGRSFLMGRAKTLECFPKLRKAGLKGSVVYYDGQQNDSRNNLMLALTSAYHGAVISNYVEVVELIKKDGQVSGALCRDRVAGSLFQVNSRGVINTTGPFTDSLRLKDSAREKIMVHSSGTHIVLPRSFAPKRMGLIDPKTTDNRILFFIPWRGKAIIGTTESRCSLERAIRPSEDDVTFILKNVRDYISKPKLLTKKKILSIWCGIRPLVKDLKAKSTASIARNHVVHVDDNKLVSLTGGKWTTYRRMAEDAVDVAIDTFGLKPERGCISEYVKILGAWDYGPRTVKRIIRKLDVSPKLGKHLNDTYGTWAFRLKKYAKSGRFSYLSDKYVFLREEVEYAVDNEMAVKGHDIIMRRMGLGFIDVKEAAKCVNTVCNILKQKLGWSSRQEKIERDETYRLLRSLGLGMI